MPTWAGRTAAYVASGMPRRSSGTRKVARSLATAMSAEHGDEQAAGLADAVDRGHDRRPAVADGQERQDVGPDVRRRFVSRLTTTAEIAAGREHVARPGDDERGQVGILVDEVDRPLDPEVHGRRQRVAGRWAGR